MSERLSSSSPRARTVRVLSLLVAPAHRTEIVADLVDEYARDRAAGRPRVAARAAFLWQLLKSALDSRRAAPWTRRDIVLTQGRTRLAGLAGDFRMAWRQHARRPSATLAAVAIIALAIGVNTALVSVVQGVLLRPLPIPHPDRVVFVWDVRAGRNEPLTPGRALDLWHRTGAFADAALLGHRSMTITGLGPAERWNGASVSASFFDVLGTAPAAGRVFHAGDAGRHLVVLSYRLWHDRFGSNCAVVGRTLVMNGVAQTVVGVMPADFFWPIVAPQPGPVDGPAFWVTAPANGVPEGPVNVAEADTAADRTTGYIRMVARLRPGETRAGVDAALASEAAALAREHPATDGGKGARLQALDDQLLGDVRQPLLFLAFASGLVVLLACVNVANLLVMRLPSRGREMAVRVALGAGRGRLIRQLLIEGVTLAVVGGVLGVGLARAALGTIVAMAPANVGRLDGVSLNGSVLAASVLAVGVSGFVLGLLPAMVVGRARPALELRTAGATLGTRPHLRQTLVALEVALAVALVVGAALFGSSLLRLRRVDVGFDTRNLLTFSVSLTGDRAEYQSKQVAFYEAMFQAIRGLPGVLSAGGAVTLPVGGDEFATPVFAEGQPIPPPGQERHVGFQIVGTRWFETLGIHVLRGRAFTADDHHRDAPVVVVNQTLATLLWPGEDPIGRHVRANRDGTGPWSTVVGVVSDIRHFGPAKPPRPEVYWSYFENSLPFLEVAVRTKGDPLAQVGPIRAAIAAIDPGQPISGVSTMQRYLEEAYGSEQFLSMLTLTFGGLALVLAVLGVYGVAGWSTAQRTREFGLRTALGATRGAVSALALRQSLMPVCWGIAAGVLAAGALSRAVRALLFDISPDDPVSFVLAGGVVLLAALVACWIPAQRAARIDPVSALRADV
jgi:putative ABC transport system permease protein